MVIDCMSPSSISRFWVKKNQRKKKEKQKNKRRKNKRTMKQAPKFTDPCSTRILRIRMGLEGMCKANNTDGCVFLRQLQLQVQSYIFELHLKCICRDGGQACSRNNALLV